MKILELAKDTIDKKAWAYVEPKFRRKFSILAVRYHKGLETTSTLRCAKVPSNVIDYIKSNPWLFKA